MIKIGSLVQWKDGSMGIVIETHNTDGCSSHAYKVRWFEGGWGVLAAWQFKVIA